MGGNKVTRTYSGALARVWTWGFRSHNQYEFSVVHQGWGSNSDAIGRCSSHFPQLHKGIYESYSINQVPGGADSRSQLTLLPDLFTHTAIHAQLRKNSADSAHFSFPRVLDEAIQIPSVHGKNFADGMGEAVCFIVPAALLWAFTTWPLLNKYLSTFKFFDVYEDWFNAVLRQGALESWERWGIEEDDIVSIRYCAGVSNPIKAFPFNNFT